MLMTLESHRAIAIVFSETSARAPSGSPASSFDSHVGHVRITVVNLSVETLFSGIPESMTIRAIWTKTSSSVMRSPVDPCWSLAFMLRTSVMALVNSCASSEVNA